MASATALALIGLGVGLSALVGVFARLDLGARADLDPSESE